jgi:hypothetical protein
MRTLTHAQMLYLYGCIYTHMHTVVCCCPNRAAACCLVCCLAAKICGLELPYATTASSGSLISNVPQIARGYSTSASNSKKKSPLALTLLSHLADASLFSTTAALAALACAHVLLGEVSCAITISVTAVTNCISSLLCCLT